MCIDDTRWSRILMLPPRFILLRFFHLYIFPSLLIPFTSYIRCRAPGKPVSLSGVQGKLSLTTFPTIIILGIISILSLFLFRGHVEDTVMMRL